MLWSRRNSFIKKTLNHVLPHVGVGCVKQRNKHTHTHTHTHTHKSKSCGAWFARVWSHFCCSKAVMKSYGVSNTRSRVCSATRCFWNHCRKFMVLKLNTQSFRLAMAKKRKLHARLSPNSTNIQGRKARIPVWSKIEKSLSDFINQKKALLLLTYSVYQGGRETMSLSP